MEILKPTLEGLKAYFEEKAECCYDEIVKPQNLFVSGERKTKFSVREELENGGEPDDPEPTEERIVFSESALGQLLNRVQIPVLFFRRCPTNLQIANFEHFNGVHDRDYFFRFDTSYGKGHVRAVLSDQYSVIDDLDLFQHIFDVTRDRNDITYRKLQHDDKVTQLLIDFNDCTGVYNGVRYTPGIAVSNSETGHSSIWIEPVVHTAHSSFYNRRVLRRQGVDCRIIHRGLLAPERVRPMFEKAKEVAQVGIVQLAEAFEDRISRDHALRFVDSVQNLPSRFRAILEEEWQDQQDIIRAEAARRIVLFAQELPLFQRIQVEQDAGKILGLFTNYKSRFSDLAQEINNVTQ